jgi:hypothetical protein
MKLEQQIEGNTEKSKFCKNENLELNECNSNKNKDKEAIYVDVEIEGCEKGDGRGIILQF